jgi:bifunctional dihydroflavonol 4-reductase/flavanone 4-reductase
VNAEDEAKTGPLLSLPGAAERLKLFQADLSKEDAFDSAVEGCEGVFDVASPMDFSKLSEVL